MMPASRVKICIFMIYGGQRPPGSMSPAYRSASLRKSWRGTRSMSLESFGDTWTGPPPQGRSSGSSTKRERNLQNWQQNRLLKISYVLERAKGIEPSYAAWEAAVLPLNYARKT